jgi:hypothetical protein
MSTRSKILVHLPCLLAPCKLALREEHRLRVFESRVLRRIFGPKGDKIKTRRRKLHNEELNNLNTSPDINVYIKSKKKRSAGHVERMDT